MKNYYGPFTTGATKALKKSERLICRTDADGLIYVCNGYFVYKMIAADYAAVVQPVTLCEPGNFEYRNGEKTEGATMDLPKLFADAVSNTENATELEACPFTLTISKDITAAAYYNRTQDFTALYNTKFLAAVSGCTIRAAKAFDPAVFYYGDQPVAMILPIKGEPKTTRAIRAYFTDAQPSDNADDDTAAQDNARRLESELDGLQEALDLALKHGADQAAELEALRAKVAELEAQHNNATQQPQEAAPTPQQPAQADTKTAAELIAARFTGFAGVTATIKGAQTASPVIWLSGETTKHAEAIKAAGGKWSGKRGAFYVRVA